MNIPFSFKLEKRLGASRMLGVFVLLTSTVLALLLGAVLLMVFDANPWDTYKAMFQGAFGTPDQWSDGQFYWISDTLV
ncbi:MAG: hypothetical protein MK000_09510 [Anaerolineales bacterium]|nr:hypothetical protein [Anaerolineales bacterium]